MKRSKCRLAITNFLFAPALSLLACGYKMPPPVSQTFLPELDKKLWTAADKHRSNLDAAVFKHAVLGSIFLKYVSDSSAEWQAEIKGMLKDPEKDFFVEPDDYDKPAKYDRAIHRELVVRDYYIEKNVFWVSALARWKTLPDSAKLPAGTKITVKYGKVSKYKINSLCKFIDDALEAVDKEKLKLKNVLNKNYTQFQIDPANLAGLIDLIATIPFQHADLNAKDILGQQSRTLATPRDTLLPELLSAEIVLDTRVQSTGGITACQ